MEESAGGTEQLAATVGGFSHCSPGDSCSCADAAWREVSLMHEAGKDHPRYGHPTCGMEVPRSLPTDRAGGNLQDRQRLWPLPRRLALGDAAGTAVGSDSTPGPREQPEEGQDE